MFSMRTKHQRKLLRYWGHALLVVWIAACVVAFLRCGFWIGLALVPVNFAAVVVLVPMAVAFTWAFVDGIVRGMLGE
jgi:hypothetical protein